jgi:aminoglycoside phosphotransferase (APT) family kinase protein
LDELPTAAVAGSLLHYFSDILGFKDCRYVSVPASITDGWETYVFKFQLEGQASLPGQFRQPLILRVFAGPAGLQVARHEIAMLRHMKELDYPVPSVVHLEESCELFGGPFMLMEQITGPALLWRALYRPGRSLLYAAQMGELHARLHQLPFSGVPASSAPLLTRSLHEVEELIHGCAMTCLAPGLDWLIAHQPAEPDSPSILHLDFHPLNVIRRPDRRWTVVDWATADVGDRHADLAATSLLFDCCLPDIRHWWERAGVWIGRPLLKAMYFHAYGKRMQIDAEKLRYYRAWAALRRLARYANCICCGPQVAAAKSSFLQHLSSAHIESVCSNFQMDTDVAICWRPPRLRATREIHE